MHGLWITRLACTFPLLLAAAACEDDGDGKGGQKPGTPSQHFQAVFTESACPFESDAEVEVSCGTLKVPENYAKPNGKMIELAVAIYESTSSRPEKDPLVYLSGGPGGGGLDEVDTLFQLGSFDRTISERDVIAIDQRGTGYSKPMLDCPEVVGINDEGEGLRVLGACRDRLEASGVDLGQYNTANNALDLRALREALGIEQWNAIGVSYGTRLVLEMMRLDGKATRSAILDSTLPPDVDNLSDTPKGMQESLATLFDACAASPECSADFPDIEPRFYALLEQLDAQPAELDLGDRVATLSGVELASAVHGMLYDAEFAEFLPGIVAELEAGNNEILELFADDGSDGGDDGMALGMYLSVICAEWAPLATPDSIAKHTSGVRPVLVEALDVPGLLEACEVWDVPAAPPSQFQAVTSSVPTLVLAGAIDPATPPRWGEHAAKTLANSRFSLWQGLSHGVIASECGGDFVADFLGELTRVEEPSCADHDEPLFASDDRVNKHRKSRQAAPSLHDGRSPLPWQR